MSLINKMLQELDRRHARAAPPGHAPHPEVRVVRPESSGREWFWRIVAGLMLVAALWTVWVVYQLQPRPVATELAYRAAENTQHQPAAVTTPPANVVAVATKAPSAPPATTAATEPAAAPKSPAPQVATPPAKPAPERLATPIEALRLALSIDTPIGSPRPKRIERDRGAAARKPVAVPTRQEQAEAPSADRARIEKREHERTPTDRAETLFRRAALLLQQGRVVDAEEALSAALAEDPAHRAARQTLVALYLEQGRIADARSQLEDGLKGNPGYVPFVVALARIRLDGRDYPGALAVLDQASEGADRGADYYSLRGAVMQRLGRDSDAANAYRLALVTGPQTGSSWVGLGISLESLGKRPEAAEAFRRAITAGGLADDVKAYAAQRVQQLK
ncbi:MAG: tetratricopeptide repeat protein [Burkholderiales bacterium]